MSALQRTLFCGIRCAICVVTLHVNLLVSFCCPALSDLSRYAVLDIFKDHFLGHITASVTDNIMLMPKFKLHIKVEQGQLKNHIGKMRDLRQQ